MHLVQSLLHCGSISLQNKYWSERQMIQKQRRRSDDEWMALIQECRTSGLSDLAWCSEHGIPSSTFYNRISRLRKKACDIPAPAEHAIQPSQQIVPLTVMEEHLATTNRDEMQRTEMPVHTPAVTLFVNGCRLEINNHAGPDTIQNTILALRQLC